ncbi:MAG: hypothetical protein EKK64_02310 [Neisseriaceae bacterium]|nr:MAG: hypothetical protein EKK64_02310 [Neisseriaceae bacterium]
MGLREEKIFQLERELRQLRNEKIVEDETEINKNIEKLLNLEWMDGHKVLLETNTSRFRFVLSFIYIKEEIKDLLYKITKRESFKKFFWDELENKIAKVKQNSFEIEFSKEEDVVEFIKNNRLSVEADDRDYSFYKITKQLNKINLFDREEHDKFVGNIY